MIKQIEILRILQHDYDEIIPNINKPWCDKNRSVKTGTEVQNQNPIQFMYTI